MPPRRRTSGARSPPSRRRLSCPAGARCSPAPDRPLGGHENPRIPTDEASHPESLPGRVSSGRFYGAPQQRRRIVHAGQVAAAHAAVPQRSGANPQRVQMRRIRPARGRAAISPLRRSPSVRQRCPHPSRTPLRRAPPPRVARREPREARNLAGPLPVVLPRWGSPQARLGSPSPPWPGSPAPSGQEGWTPRAWKRSQEPRTSIGIRDRRDPRQTPQTLLESLQTTLGWTHLVEVKRNGNKGLHGWRGFPRAVQTEPARRLPYHP